MINGRYDNIYHVETSAEPLFQSVRRARIGQEAPVLDSGHTPQPALLWIKEALDWLDRYLGPVGKPAAS